MKEIHGFGSCYKQKKTFPTKDKMVKQCSQQLLTGKLRGLSLDLCGSGTKLL